jgi:hypothetical protein
MGPAKPGLPVEGFCFLWETDERASLKSALSSLEKFINDGKNAVVEDPKAATLTH